jgi:hypothetical protein
MRTKLTTVTTQCREFSIESDVRSTLGWAVVSNHAGFTLLQIFPSCYSLNDIKYHLRKCSVIVLYSLHSLEVTIM